MWRLSRLRRPALAFLLRGTLLGRNAGLVRRESVLLRRDVDLVVPRDRPLEVLDALAQGIAELRQLARAEDEEDDDEDEQQLAETEIHRKVSSSGKLARRCSPRTSTVPDGP